GEAVAVVVADQDDAVLGDHRRGGEAQFRVELAQLAAPEFLAVQVITDGPGVAEEGDDVAAVGRRGGGGVPGHHRGALGGLVGDLARPERLAAAAIKAVQDAALAPVQGRGQEDAVLPDDGGGRTFAGHVGLPADVLGGGPAQRQRRCGGDGVAVGGAPARPGFGAGQARAGGPGAGPRGAKTGTRGGGAGAWRGRGQLAAEAPRGAGSELSTQERRLGRRRSASCDERMSVSRWAQPPWTKQRLPACSQRSMHSVLTTLSLYGSPAS